MDAVTLEESLYALRDCLNFWMGIATGAVALGLLLEYWPELREAVRSRRWRPLLPKIGWLLIVVGVSGEWFLHSRLSQVDDRLLSLQYRSLSPDELASLVSNVKSFAGEAAIFGVSANDVEAAKFALQIANALQDGARWEASVHVELHLGGIEPGITMTSTGDQKSRDAAATLARELTKDGFPVPDPTSNGDNQDRVGMIWIEVGPKPLPTLRAKR